MGRPPNILDLENYPFREIAVSVLVVLDSRVEDAPTEVISRITDAFGYTLYDTVSRNDSHLKPYRDYQKTTSFLVTYP